MSNTVNNQYLKAMIADCVDELIEMPDGSETTIRKIVVRLGYDEKELEHGFLTALFTRVRRAARKANVTLEVPENAPDEAEPTFGFSYDLPFTVKNRGAGIKCPRCGSRNTARILYGMPDFSDDVLKAKIDADKVYIGGCLFSPCNPSRRCNNCKKEFGAPGILLADGSAEYFEDVVTGLRFERIGYNPSKDIFLSIEKTERGALVSADVAHSSLTAREISRQKWEALVRSLYSDLYLGDWKKRYKDRSVMICDGEEWKLTVGMTGGRKRTYSGVDGFPPYRKEFLGLLKPYLKERI